MDFINNSRFQPERPTFQPPQQPDDDELSFGQSLLQFLWETAKVVIISLLIIIPVRYFLIQPFFVNGASMEPNFYDHEYLIIDEISYRLTEPHRGDIVVFRDVRDTSQFFIKRVIGLPGETVIIREGRITIINETHPTGFVLDESGYLPGGLETRGDISVTLDQDEYYVLGDNRHASLDSRSFGPVPVDHFVGRAWLRGWPIDRVTLFERPQY